MTTRTRSRRLSPAVLIALLALVVALGGPSYAAKMITGKDIKNNSVTGADIKQKSLTGGDIKNGSVLSADLKAGTITAMSFGRKKVTAKPGIDSDTARVSAPRVKLFKKGVLTIYGKCWTDTTADRTYYQTYIASSANGSIFDSRSDSQYGGSTAADFLNPSTDETDAELEGDSAGNNDSSTDAEDDSDFVAWGSDGTTLRGWTGGAVRNGTLAFSGPFGSGGDVCLFTGGVFVG